jgi:uncharacterized protein (UPF0371 family)
LRCGHRPRKRHHRDRKQLTEISCGFKPVSASKHLAEIPDKIKLLPPNIVDSVRNLKTKVLNEKTLSLDLVETLIALSISATGNPAAQLAMEKLEKLQGCEVHMTHIPTPGDEAGLRRLGVNLTSDPNFSTKDLFISQPKYFRLRRLSVSSDRFDR